MSLRYKILHPESRNSNSTFWGEICVEYESWCRENCQGEYEINNIETVMFENRRDAMKFIDAFWSVRIIEMDVK